MANDTCPHCGDEIAPINLNYLCGTIRDASLLQDGDDGRSDACRMTTIRNQLATVTAERDELRRQKELDDYHILKLQRVLDGSTKRHRQKRETINGLQQQLDDLRRRLAEAPVGYVVQSITDQFPWTVLKSRPSVLNGLTRVRLVRDDQPGEES